MPKFLTIETQLVKEVEPILNEVGIDLDSVVKMTLKRIIRDHDISFLMAKTDNGNNETAVQRDTLSVEDRISKGRAISLFESKGIRFNRNVTFASKNRSAYNYWANPYFFALENDWYLILNDWQKRELHLFVIPARSIDPNRMVCRVDQRDKIDLQICYNDPTYTDNRSKISFSKYLVKDIRY
jgi:antitoxin component of RelBE/YafQ-DinJ toxin-antitoxin module